MKECKLSQETQAVLKAILCDIEHIRQKANDQCDFPPSDYPYRPCQAIIAAWLGFEGRAEWHKDEVLGFEAKL
jgi:hypothetical protein